MKTAQPAGEVAASKRETAEIGVGGMTCAACVSAVEKALDRVPGVGSVSVNLATERARIEYDPHAAGSRPMVSWPTRENRKSGREELKR